MSDIESRLSSIKRSIDQSRDAKSRAEGEITAIMRDLKDKHGISSIEEAEARLAELETSITTRQTKLTRRLDDLEEELDAR